jgi:SAM-dependent methyltransferase
MARRAPAGSVVEADKLRTCIACARPLCLHLNSPVVLLTMASLSTNGNSMEKSLDCTEPEFWSIRYASGRTPWDFGGVPGALKSFFARSAAPGSVLIPGCGAGYEVQAFHAAGFDVTAIDFSPAAFDQAKTVLGGLAEKVILGDFFTHPFGSRPFDLIYERTFLCSMPPTRWPDYANRMADLVMPGGRLVGVFLYGPLSSSGPPYPITDNQSQELFQKNFQLVRSEPMTDSLPLFSGMERWQEWQR